MHPPAAPHAQPPSQSPLPGREVVRLEHLQNAPGEGIYQAEQEHTLFLSLARRPIPYVQVQDGKTFRGLYRPGDMLITPAGTLLRVRWEGDEDCVKIQLAAAFLQKIAQETLNLGGDRPCLQPAFQVRNEQIGAIAQLLLTETQHPNLGHSLYSESLANALAIALLRHHTTTQPTLPSYEGGLLPQHLHHILDYIDAHLDQDLHLEQLAHRLNLSQFHFSRLFKQSTGLSPYHYLLQRRIERAKHLLHKTDHSIADIALACGFNSHSHLTKQFRHITGTTPKSFRSTSRGT